MAILPNKNGLFLHFFSCMLELSVVIFASKKTPCLADSNGEAERGFLFGTQAAGAGGRGKRGDI